MKSKIQLFIPLILAFISLQFFITNEAFNQWVGISGFVLTIILGIWSARQARGWLKLIPVVTVLGVVVYVGIYALLIFLWGNG